MVTGVAAAQSGCLPHAGIPEPQRCACCEWASWITLGLCPGATPSLAALVMQVSDRPTTRVARDSRQLVADSAEENLSILFRIFSGPWASSDFRRFFFGPISWDSCSQANSPHWRPRINMVDVKMPRCQVRRRIRSEELATAASMQWQFLAS